MRLTDGTIWDFDVDHLTKNVTHLFITHAHSDHIPRGKIPPHVTLVTSNETYELLKLYNKISPNHKNVILSSQEIHGIQVSFLSAGHTLGSLAFRLVFSDGASFLYTGDFSTEQKQGITPFKPVKTDHVLMEATYGRKDFVFPPANMILNQAKSLIEDASTRSAIVLRAYPYGKTQTLLASSLGSLVTGISSKPYQISKLLYELGHKLSLPDPTSSPLSRGDIYLAGPRETVQVVPGVEVLNISFTGWAKTRRNRGFPGQGSSSNQYSLGFPLSDHADYNQLLSTAKSLNALSIGVFCGYKKYFVKVLRDAGFFAYDLVTQQVSLDHFLK